MIKRKNFLFIKQKKKNRETKNGKIGKKENPKKKIRVNWMLPCDEQEQTLEICNNLYR